ncbi:MAG TPA: discoidin domain-containing protein [Chitinophagaceae bacterium]|nr:discoidin domain-containing protein [Chitinophagaceae bacterium]HMU58171.1 discoidin domain-containing protein [Chitinophagaceae bacterium]
MKNICVKLLFVFIFLLVGTGFLFAQVKILDNFETKVGWSFIRSDAVELKTSVEKGHAGSCVRFDYDFTKGTGYGGMQKMLPLILPENYEISFWVKANSPSNNFEIKLLDASGDNVWWVSNRNYTFPNEWKKIKIKKRHLTFAWGPSGGIPPVRFDRIEFTIASFVGGKGTVWIDDLRFEALPPETNNYPQPSVTATSAVKENPAQNVLDNSSQSVWQSVNAKPQSLVFDLKKRREFGGLHINWTKNQSADKFDIYTSNDAKKWEKLTGISGNQNNVSIIRLPDADARYLKLSLLSANSQTGYGIEDIKLVSMKDAESLNNFYIYCSKNNEAGDYPRYFSEKASYWTVSGVNNDVKEALLNEDGMVEPDAASFSLEPMIMLDNKLYNWSNVSAIQSMGKSSRASGYQFVPGVTWNIKDLVFETEIASAGTANTNSSLYIKYRFTNKGKEKKDFDFYLLLRPYQVNPYYQFLNLTGGVGKIGAIEEVAKNIIKVDNKIIESQIPFQQLSAHTASQGNIVSLIRSEKLNALSKINDSSGLASGVIKYKISFDAGADYEFIVKIPYHHSHTTADAGEVSDFNKDFSSSIDFWKSKINHIQFNLPASADRIINTYKSQLVYILINRDKTGIQPGSRSYNRSWIRDGALTSSALMKSGIVPEVKDFIKWYSGYLYENGKVPCVVDGRGPDPVPENDSHGQFIYLLREYFNFTKDTTFLREMNGKVLMAADYIQSLIAQRSTDHYRNGNDSVRAQYGLVPESISHEGYSAKPMHSYWDDFFTMKGLKDAVDIQKILGETENEKRIAVTRDNFRTNLYNSINLAMKYKGIDYIPGCAELGDFDATSTTVSLTPCNEMDNLPKPQIYNTFDKYYDFFTKRRNNTINWVNYTPYENRVIGSFIMLNQPDRAHELIDYFLHDQRPQGWYHWAEVVWKDERTPQYIGDMPHTWVGSDFINAIRSMFVYENEYDSSLVLAAALYQDWIDAPAGMSVKNLPTYYGEISYSIKKENNSYRFSISGDLKLPANGIKIQNFNGSKLPKRVMVNGKEISTFTDKYIQIMASPSEVVIEY